MKIKIKLIVGSVLLVLIPGLLVGVAVGVSALQTASSSLEHAVSQQLIAVRDSTKRSIVDYFDTINNQVLTLSASPLTVEAMSSLTVAFKNYRKETNLTDVDALKGGVSSYYSKQFGAKYSTMNNGQIVSTAQLINTLDDDSIALQHAYISANSNALGEKEKLDANNDNSEYSRLHKRFHPFFREYLDRFGYYDIFLVDIDSGDIVYSVFKELDYSTSLKNGPYKDTGIGTAFKSMSGQSKSSISSLTDFAPYLPSYEAPAAFISSPIFDGDKQIGVLIFQMPIERINSIMTHKQSWKEAGLGESGETYLVGEDHTLRSESRFLIEDMPAYLSLMKSIGVSEDIIRKLSEKETGIGIQKVDTHGTQAALAGTTGFDIFNDYRGVSVLSAYTPINLLGQQWALMSEIDEAEAFKPVVDLTATIVSIVIGIVAVLGVGALLIGFGFSAMIVRPINKTVSMMKDIAEGDGDLTQRLEDNGKDELDELASWLNRFLNDLQKMIKDFKSHAMTLASASTELSQTAEETGSNMQLQLRETSEVSVSIAQLSSTVQSVSLSANNTASSANSALEGVQHGTTVIGDSVSSMNSLSNEVEQAVDVIAELQAHVVNIGGVLDVIKGIAEQTNLLALNAAIEAARAGEQGRGFAVVADEVRTLASRTQESTEEINNMIEVLQKGTEHAVKVMNISQETAKKGVVQSSEASKIFNEISAQVTEINGMMMEVASATEQQSVTAEQINKSVQAINDGVNHTANSSEESVKASSELANIANQLQEQIERFKV